MGDLNKVDILFIGAGPASLAGAIKIKQLLNEAGRSESVVVIEKAAKPGQHNLSGAVFEAQVLDELIPDWRKSEDKFVTGMLANQVHWDEVVFLSGEKRYYKIPEMLVPQAMRHHGNYVISVSEMVAWLTDIALKLGVEIYHGFAAKQVIYENNRVIGVRLGDKGLNKEGNKLNNYVAGETIESKVTVLGEGSAGQLAADLIRNYNLDAGKNPQIYSLGVKEVIKLPPNNNFGTNHVIHTLGYPLPASVFGGGAIYSMGNNHIAVALIIGLNWRYCNLNPQRELQLFKSQPIIRSFIKDGRVVAYGAKTIPEGGYYSLPKLVADGALIIGDDAGLTSVKKLKGLHYAIKSGIAAAETIFQAVKAQDFTQRVLNNYQERLDNSFVMKEIRAARNYRQVFTRAGLYGGLPLSFIQSWFPFKLSTKPDYEGMRITQLIQNDEVAGIDRSTAVKLVRNGSPRR